MKLNIKLALAVLLLASFACGLPAGSEPEQTGQAEAPAPESGGDTAPVQEEPALPVGPETLDLDSAALFATEGYPSSTITIQSKNEGTDESGGNVSNVYNGLLKSRTTPDNAVYFATYGEDMSNALEYAEINDLIFSVYSQQCSVLPLSSKQGDYDPTDEMINFSEFLSGQASLAEVGVEVEGFVTDRYALTSDNVASPYGDIPMNLQYGNVYVARENGAAVKVEIVGSFDTLPLGTSSLTNATLSMFYTFVPSDEPLAILPPASCADADADLGKYPVMEGATGPSSVNGNVFYQVSAPLADVLNFYRTEMVAQGWQLTNDASVESASLGLLEFSKDGVTVSVSMIQNGDVVAVSIK